MNLTDWFDTKDWSVPFTDILYVDIVVFICLLYLLMLSYVSFISVLFLASLATVSY